MFTKPKYHNEKVKAPEGVFDSKLEYRRFIFLREEQTRGHIANLRRQVKFILIPKQKELVEYTKQYKSRGKSSTKRAFKERILFKECSYTADFVYEIPVSNPSVEDQVWMTVVEDTKSYATAHSKEFVIKQKLMYYLKQIRLHIVTSASEPVPAKPSCANPTQNETS